MVDELTEEQLDDRKQALDLLLVELEKIISETKEQMKPIDLDLPIGRLSRIDAIQQKKMMEAQRFNAQRRLQ